MRQFQFQLNQEVHGAKYICSRDFSCHYTLTQPITWRFPNTTDTTQKKLKSSHTLQRQQVDLFEVADPESVVRIWLRPKGT